jgi:hypothetical protein
LGVGTGHDGKVAIRGGRSVLLGTIEGQVVAYVALIIDDAAHVPHL